MSAKLEKMVLAKDSSTYQAALREIAGDRWEPVDENVSYLNLANNSDRDHLICAALLKILADFDVQDCVITTGRDSLMSGGSHFVHIELANEKLAKLRDDISRSHHAEISHSNR